MATARTFSDDLRDAIKRSGKTRYQISAETGVAQSVLSRFVTGKSGLSLASVDAVCECLRLTVTERKPAVRRGGR